MCHHMCAVLCFARLPFKGFEQAAKQNSPSALCHCASGWLRRAHEAPRAGRYGGPMITELDLRIFRGTCNFTTLPPPSYMTRSR